MVPAETSGEQPAAVGKRGDRVLFWRVFWLLAVVECLGLSWWFRERFAEKPVGTLCIVTLVPVLILGHVNVFPASLAARIWRRRHRDELS